MVRHKVFISFHSKDIYYKELFESKFGHLYTCQSVNTGDIDENHSSEYVKRLINEGYIDDASVVIVLVGAKTYCRKHVDWEISAGLSVRVGGRAGLLAICIPGSADYPGPTYNSNVTPARLVDNLVTGYASYYDWSDDESTIANRIENAFNARLSKADLVNNGRLQLQNNLCD